MFSIKRLRVTFQLSTGSFEKDGENYDTFSLDDAAIQAKINETASGEATLELSVYGVPNDVINRLTVTMADPKKFVSWTPNKISLELLDKDDNAELLFSGSIAVCVADYNSAPDIPLQVIAHPWYEAAMKRAMPLSFNGTARADVILGTIADEIGVGFTSYGAETVLNDVSLNGDSWTMIREVCGMANLDFILTKNMLKVAPKGHSDRIKTTYISRETGMVGYPRVVNDGILVTCAFSSEYTVLREVELYTKEIDAAQGKFVIRGVDHSIDSQTPDGRWYSDLALSYYLEGE